MKFRCTRQMLLEGFQVVGAVVSTHAIKQIYESVKVVTRDGSLELLATDLEVAIRYVIPEAEIIEAGALAVPAARMTGILREIREDEVEVSWQDGATNVTAGGSRFTVLGEDPEEFPRIPEMGEGRTITIPKQTFRELIERTAFSAAKERTRYALNGILLLVQGSEVRCVATDGRRLALALGETENPEEIEVEAIVPAKGMSMMLRTLSDDDEVLELRIDDNQASAKTSRAIVASRLVEGVFPKWQEVIPANCSHEIELDRIELIGALRKAKLLTNQESRSVRLRFGEGRLVIASRALEVGEAHVEMNVEFDGPEVEVGFNPDYLIEALNVVKSEKVLFAFNGPTSPGKLTDGDTFTYIVMPVSLE
jgi:DNA polymerase III subunit beta